MKKLLVLSLALPVIVLAGCSGTMHGLKSGYSLLPDDMKARVMKPSVPLGQLKNDGNVYKVTVADVKAYAQQHDRVVIYVWNPYCPSETCILPTVAEGVCQEGGVDFLLIQDLYDKDAITAMSVLDTPLLVIDTEPYGTEYRHRYEPRFEEDLADGLKGKVRGWGRFHVYENGKYAGTFDSVEEAVAGKKNKQ